MSLKKSAKRRKLVKALKSCCEGDWNHSLRPAEARFCHLSWSQFNQKGEKKHPPFPLIPSSSQDPRTCDEPCAKSSALISLLFLCGPTCKFSQQRASWELVKTVTWGKLYFTGNPKPPTHPHSVLCCTHIQCFHPSLTALHSDLH